MAINEELRSNANNIVKDLYGISSGDTEGKIMVTAIGWLFNAILEGLSILDDIRSNTEGKLSNDFKPGR